MAKLRKKRTSSKKQNFLPVFEFHGADLSKSGTQYAGICPLCEDEDPLFFVNSSTGQWDCKHCGGHGNVYTFLHALYLVLRESTSESKLNSLAKSRRLPPAAIRDAGFVFDPDSGRYLLPIYNRLGSLVNLKAYVKEKRQFYNSPSPIISHLFNSQKLTSSKDVIYVCEGEWDAIALENVFNSIPKTRRPKGTVVAVPGADNTGVFTEKILPLLEGKEIVLMYDHDEAGKRGTQKLIKLLATKGITDIRILRWPESYPAGYDVSDHLYKTKIDPEKAWAQIVDWMEPATDEISKLGTITSTIIVKDLPKLEPRLRFSHVISDFRRHGAHINRDMEGGLAIAAATGLSNELPGDPLWFFLVGPSGCISGDAHLKYVIKKDGKLVNKKGGKFKTLYERFHGLASKGPRPPRTKGTVDYYIPSVRDDGTVFLNEIHDVIDSGVKTVYKVTTASGKSVKATSNHPFMTPDGYVPLEKLSVGDVIWTYDGKRQKKTNKKKRPHRKEILVKAHPRWIKKVVNGCTYYRVKEYQAVIEADKNGMSLKEYVNYLNNCTEQEANSLWCIPEGVNVHHIDENPHNNELSNLLLLDHTDHVKEHWEPIYPSTTEDRIVSIKKLGKEQVYDLKVADPYKNFVVEGFAVHNSGKSMILDATMASDNYLYRTTTNYQDLLSGHKGEDEENTTLLKKLINRTFVVKDWTAIMGMPREAQQEMNGLLRDAYDGLVSRSYGHGKEVLVEGFFSFLAGVTNKIHSQSNSHLGERFLKYEIAGAQGLGNKKAILQAISGGMRSAEDIRDRKYRQASFCSFVDTLRENIKKRPKNHTVAQSTIASVVAMSQFVAICRAVVERDRAGALLYEASPEAGTRLGKQLIKLPQALCHVYGLKKPDQIVLDIVAKTAWDSAYSRIRKLYTTLYAHTPNPEDPKSGLTTNEIVEMTLWPKTTVKRTLEDMRELGVVRARVRSRAASGRPDVLYRLLKEAREIYRACGF